MNIQNNPVGLPVQTPFPWQREMLDPLSSYYQRANFNSPQRGGYDVATGVPAPAPPWSGNPRLGANRAFPWPLDWLRTGHITEHNPMQPPGFLGPPVPSGTGNTPPPWLGGGPRWSGGSPGTQLLGPPIHQWGGIPRFSWLGGGGRGGGGF